MNTRQIEILNKVEVFMEDMERRFSLLEKVVVSIQQAKYEKPKPRRRGGPSQQRDQ